MSTRLVSFRGKIGAGKTFAATHLVNQHGFTRVAFADALKLEVFDALWCDDINSLPHVKMSDPGFPSYYRAMQSFIEITKPDRTLLEFDLYYVFEEVKMNWINERKLQLRPLLQWWGTEYRRAQSESYWLNKWIESTTEVLLHGGRVVVDDARFDNEIDAIVNLGGKHVFIETADEARAERLTQRDGAVNLGIASHASEQSVDSTDPRNSLILQNKGSHFLMNLDFAVNVDF